MKDPDEISRLIPELADVWAAAEGLPIRDATEAKYRRALSDPNSPVWSVAIAQTADDRVAGFRAGSLYTGPRSLWRDSFGGPLLVPRDGGTHRVSAATRERWADQPVPHGLAVAVRPEFRRQGLAKDVTQAWGDARPADERYATGHIAADNTASLATFRSLGGQIIGTRENGRYFYLLPLRGQSPAEVDHHVATIQRDTPEVDAAVSGLVQVSELPQGLRAAPGHEVALPISRAIEHAVDLGLAKEQ
ncbi:N-acetyltransferase family protein [Yinghuangia sp. YIM S09857]|uniref:GNAT family N-acetyltransferase n=1 Tax=Yinghuangia sp. YIM S09857 TaxID=3436929 RepID=UPI003F52FB9C